MRKISSIIIVSALLLAQNASAQDIDPRGMTGNEDEAVAAASAHGKIARQHARLAHQRQQRDLRQNETGALSGKRISLSPGHGMDYDNGWGFQRGTVMEIREDIHTLEWIVDLVQPMLNRAGAQTLMMRGSSYMKERADMPISGDNYIETGNWSASGEGDYRYSYVAASETAKATWKGRVAASGVYPVYAKFRSGTNRMSNALYTIKHAKGEIQLKVNQADLHAASTDANSITQDTTKSSSQLYHLLGYFPLKANEDVVVTLSNAGSEAEASAKKVVIADNIRIGEGLGDIVSGGNTSGKYKWQESALTWLKWLGAPSWVLNNDVQVRSLYSLYEGVDMMLSLHTNACCGGSGTQTYVWIYDDSSGNMQWVRSTNWPANYADNNLPPGTYDYAYRVQTNIAKYFRTVKSDWVAGDYVMSSNFGELRPIRNAWYHNKSNNPLIIPAILVEIAFHDNASDVSYISELNFRELGARAIVAGMIQHFKGDNALLPPMRPTKLKAVSINNKMNITWENGKDPVYSNYQAEKYNIYTSDDGLLFDKYPTMTVTEPKASLDLSDDQTLYVKVTAVNSAGESLDSMVAVGRHKQSTGKQILYVDGVDREVKLEADPNNVRSYARIYGPALSWNHASTGIDTVDDDAVDQIADLSAYQLVVWAVGETNARYGALDSKQIEVIKKLQAIGIPVVISGSELLETLSSQASELFDVTLAKAAAGSTTVSMNNQSYKFGDCSEDAICVESPDELTAQNGAQAVMNYDHGGTAAVWSANKHILTVGLPLESLSNPSERICVIANLAETALGGTINASCTKDVYVPEKKHEICGNGIDDDGNGQKDCEDEACKDTEACKSDEPVKEICDNDIDDDGNGKKDCEDEACKDTEACKSAGTDNPDDEDKSDKDDKEDDKTGDEGNEEGEESGVILGSDESCSKSPQPGDPKPLIWMMAFGAFWALRRRKSRV